MSEAVSSWLKEQQTVVEVSGRHAESLRLVGPDEQVWQQWPIDAEGLDEQVERMMNALGEQMPTGKHRGMLVVTDNKGDQYSAFPVVFHGRNTAASSAAQETRTLQQSTSIAIANLENVIEIQRNELTRMGQQVEEMRENEQAIIEVLNEYRTQNLEVDLMMREYEDKKESRENFQRFATPMLMQLTQTLGPALAAKVKANKEKADAKRRARGNGANGAASQSNNGAAVHGTVQSTGSEGSSPANGKDSSVGGRKKPRARASRKAKAESVKN